MFLMYVDESGDSGLVNSPTQHFVLSGLVIHDTKWHATLDRLIAFRRRMKARYGLRLREEIHASELINRPGALVRIPKHDRLAILRAFASELSQMPDLNVVNVVVTKTGRTPPYNAFDAAWTALIQRFENTLGYRNFRGGPPGVVEFGILIPDRTDEGRLRKRMRTMRRYNPIPSLPQHSDPYRDMPLSKLVEDPMHRDSRHSYFIQACDVIAYFLYQSVAPSGYMRRKGGHRYFNTLAPILCRVASRSDAHGIVRL